MVSKEEELLALASRQAYKWGKYREWVQDVDMREKDCIDKGLMREDGEGLGREELGNESIA